MIYYNENDRHAAEWLRQLIRDGQILSGWVDERSIEDVKPEDLTEYTQCHFFAGIGGWPLALAWAGWPTDRPVWTGSCPCQPFSTAGKRGGSDDPRALWWAWRWLIDQCRPATVFGEQVAPEAGREWLAGVRTDLEAMGYAIGAADLCAAGVGAPQIRQRLWWVADAQLPEWRQERGARPQVEGEHPVQRGREENPSGYASSGKAGGLQHAPSGRLANADNTGPQGRGVLPERADERTAGQAGMAGGLQHGWGVAGGGWTDAVWVECADGKARRLEPGIEPLVNGLPGRVGLLRGYGNAIVPQVAATFIKAYLDTR